MEDASKVSGVCLESVWKVFGVGNFLHTVSLDWDKYESMKVSKYASMQACKYASMQVC